MEDHFLREDYAKLKKQIKDWELRIDELLASDDVLIDSRTGDELQALSQEMMSVNM